MVLFGFFGVDGTTTGTTVIMSGNDDIGASVVVVDMAIVGCALWLLPLPLLLLLLLDDGINVVVDDNDDGGGTTITVGIVGVIVVGVVVVDVECREMVGVRVRSTK
jgi:hypothetical protein